MVEEGKYAWWNAYGAFRAGANSSPHMGDVMRYYARINRMKHQDVAELLGCTVRYVEMLLSKGNITMPDSINRRNILAAGLGIPPALFGLADTHTEEAKQEIAIMHHWEGLLSMAWELYYTSSVVKARENIETSLQDLEQACDGANGTKGDQLNALRCRFYQVYSLVLRDSSERPKGIEYTSKALTIGLKLNNAELIASSYLRRARCLIGNGDLLAAYRDAMAMLPYADLARDPLKAKCYQMAGESTSLVSEHDKNLQTTSIHYFSVAGKIIRKGDLTPDGSYARSDLTSLYIEKADALILFGLYKDARAAIEVARKNLSPEQNRWQINLCVNDCKLYLAQGMGREATLVLDEAETLAQALNLETKKASIKQLRTKIAAL